MQLESLVSVESLGSLVTWPLRILGIIVDAV